MNAGIPRSWVVPGELLVRFRGGTEAQERRELHSEVGAKVLERIRTFGVDVVRVPRGSSVTELAASYEQDPLVEAVEPNLRRTLTDTEFADQWGHENTGQQHAIADPPPTTAAGLADGDADTVEAWATQDGDNNATSYRPVIAVIDSGVDTSHLDIAPNLWENPGEVANNSI
ncbi:MAG TPA: hypothetical protein VEA19_00530, partial [Actinomycetota bacterium]|nr:hypothetical protein [Actinomycetota bacterium]